MSATIQLFQKQNEFLQHVLDPTSRLIVYGGAVKGGKTTAGLVGLHALMRPYANAKSAIVRESLPSLKRNTYPHYYKFKPNEKISGSPPYNVKPQGYRGSEIIFFPENYNQDKELNRWKGLDVNYFLLEELNELHKDSFYKAFERAGTWLIPSLSKSQQPPPKIIATLNPARGFVKDEIYDPWRNGTLKPSWRFIQALPQDNPHNTQDWLDSQKENLPTYNYNVFFRGDWDALVLENAFLDEFDIDRHVKEVPLIEQEMIYISFDFNVNPMTASVWQHTEDYIHKVKEYFLPNSSIYDLCSVIRRDFSSHIFGSWFRVNGDASGSNRSAFTQGNITAYEIIKAEFSCSWLNIEVPEFNPSIANSRLVINSVYKNEKELFIDKNCVETIKDYQECPKDYKGREFSDRYPKRGHLLDTDRYYIQQNHYEKISKYGIDDQTLSRA